MHDPKKIAKVQAWVDPVAARMFVAYAVRVHQEHSEENTNATIQRYGGGFAMHLGSGFFSLPRDEKRIVLVHELAHTYFAQMDSVHEGMLSKRLSPLDADTWKALAADAEHDAIDRITRDLAPMMPLPKF